MKLYNRSIRLTKAISDLEKELGLKCKYSISERKVSNVFNKTYLEYCNFYKADDLTDNEEVKNEHIRLQVHSDIDFDTQKRFVLVDYQIHNDMRWVRITLKTLELLTILVNVLEEPLCP